MTCVRSSINSLTSSIHNVNRQAFCSEPTFPDAGIQLSVDESLFKQAVLNLLINALQAMTGEESASGRELLVRMERDEEEMRLHVIDNGPGIPQEMREEIFRPYVSSKPGGCGLGLPTARRIIEEHGGRIEVHTEPGRGSDFIIHLPLHMAE